MTIALVTGASRGIGLGIVEELLKRSASRVIATCRNPATAGELQKLSQVYSDRLLVLPLDVTDQSSHVLLKSVLLSSGVDKIDVLIANAGVLHRNNIQSVTAEEMRADFETNVIGSMYTVTHLEDLVRKSSSHKCIMFVSSTMGSISIASKMGGYPSYRVSKAGLNMYAATYAADPSVRESGLKVISLHPGWVRTDMGGSGADVSVEESVTGILHVVDSVAASIGTAVASIPPDYDMLKDKLATENLAYVRFTGELIDW